MVLHFLLTALFLAVVVVVVVVLLLRLLVVGRVAACKRCARGAGRNADTFGGDDAQMRRAQRGGRGRQGGSRGGGAGSSLQSRRLI